MAIRDWITFPRSEDGWHTRANAWMNELKDCVTDLVTRMVAVEAEGEYSDYTPTFTNFGTDPTITTAETARIGDVVFVFLDLVLTAVPTTAMGVSLPVAPARQGNAVMGQAVGTIGGSEYEGQIEISGSSIFVLRASDAGVVTAFWGPGVPGVWAIGSRLVLAFSYKAA